LNSSPNLKESKNVRIPSRYIQILGWKKGEGTIRFVLHGCDNRRRAPTKRERAHPGLPLTAILLGLALVVLATAVCSGIKKGILGKGMETLKQEIET